MESPPLSDSKTLFHHPKKKPLSYQQSLSPSHMPPHPTAPGPQPPATANLPSVSMALPIPDISYKWNPTMGGLFCLPFKGPWSLFPFTSHLIQKQGLLALAPKHLLSLPGSHQPSTTTLTSSLAWTSTTAPLGHSPHRSQSGHSRT